MAGAVKVFNPLDSLHRLDHVLSIGLPVSRKMNAAAISQKRQLLRDEVCLHKPAFVMTLLMPRIGKENEQPRDAGRR